MTSTEQEILVCGPENGRWHLEMRIGNGAPERLAGEFDSPDMAIAGAQQVYPSIPVRVTDISGAPAPSAPAHEGSLTDYHYGGHSVTRDEKLTGRAHPSSDTSQPPPGPHPYQATDLGNLPAGTPRHGMYGVASTPAEAAKADEADRKDEAARRHTGSRDAED